MSLYTDIKKLVDKNNKEYLHHFMNYVQKESKDTPFSNKVRDLVTSYINFTQNTIVVKQCQYVIQRGANNGKQCSVQVKDINGTYCVKHKKYEQPKDVEPVVSEEENDEIIIDDAPVSDADAEEEWFNNDEEVEY